MADTNPRNAAKQKKPGQGTLSRQRRQRRKRERDLIEGLNELTTLESKKKKGKQEEMPGLVAQLLQGLKDSTGNVRQQKPCRDTAKRKKDRRQQQAIRTLQTQVRAISSDTHSQGQKRHKGFGNKGAGKGQRKGKGKGSGYAANDSGKGKGKGKPWEQRWW